jgi:hypothetical protein
MHYKVKGYTLRYDTLRDIDNPPSRLAYCPFCHRPRLTPSFLKECKPSLTRRKVAPIAGQETGANGVKGFSFGL